jgi:hypothetical protein
LILSQPQRDAIAAHVAELEVYCAPVAADAKTKVAIAAEVTKLMLVLPGMRQNDISAEARGEAYMAALDDVPLWAVAAAARLWYRGESGKDYDYAWCPAPAALRKLALSQVAKLEARAKTLRDLLDAEPALEFDQAHCAMMQKRFVDLLRTRGIL